MIRKLSALLLDPAPSRTVSKALIQRFQLGSYVQRLRIGAVDRPHYGYCVYQAALLAKKLGYDRISVLEFGVAGGNGLLNLEYHAQEVSQILGVGIDIYGFDLGEGLPKPLDYRDMPYLFKENFYAMDLPKLQARLKKAKLVLGDIKDTSTAFFEKYTPAPIGAIIYDFDFYSSTAAALKMLDSDPAHYLPRLFCYFDDTVGSETQLYNDYTGERLAISEFNQTHAVIKFSLPYHLLAKKIVEPWYHRIWIAHLFEHGLYNQFISAEDQHFFNLAE